ncbi:MAG: glycerophosphodiester phosphodiesterase family protein [Actinobacteria bacterium]|nr:glycerophosphodiester phosphodiesterase family protein [Actinomycetota bacterium]
MTIACAHRGDSSRYRENTLVAIKSAIKSGAEMVEIDVRLSKDGEVVVIHDPTLERLWGISSPVSEVNWDSMKRLGDGENRLPLLSEVLELFVGSSSSLMIDMEEVFPASKAFRVTDQGPLDQSQIRWCGNLDGMRTIRALSTSAKIWMPWEDIAIPEKSEISELSPEFVNLHYSFVSKESVDAFHAMGYKVSAWTIDDEASMRWALSIGVDSITTNELALLQRVFSEGILKDRRVERSIDEIDLEKAMLIAHDLGAWAILVASSMDPGEMSLKENPADIVTRVDVMIERHVREVIAANFPGHNFVGEEMGGKYQADTPSWYLDPIDGTTNFANRMPWSSFSLALAFNRTPLVAVVIDPWRSSLFEARAGKGAKLNGREIKVEDQSGIENPLSSRIVATELAAYQPWPGMLGLLQGLADNYCTMRIMGSGTLTLVGVSVGRGVGSVIGHYSPIDHLAACLIVHEAGGAVWDEEGNVNLFPEVGGILCATQAAARPLFDIWMKSIK